MDCLGGLADTRYYAYTGILRKRYAGFLVPGKVGCTRMLQFTPF
jgi:hypothetical protein